MKYRNILVTGGAGFIGSSIAVYLKEKYPRVRVTALDNLKRRGGELNLPRLAEYGVEFVHADIRVPEDLAAVAKTDLLIECSAEPSVMAGYGDNPQYIINTNLTGAVNCFELARRSAADVIFFSTSRVYPYQSLNAVQAAEKASRYEWKHNQEIPGCSDAGVTTLFPLAGPKTLYGATKLSAELILQEYCAAYKMRGIINRCGVIAGPWQFGKVDQGVFTYWMLAHFFKKRVNYIGFGGEGKQVRDLLHIDDLCGLLDAQINSMDKASCRAYNVGGGREGSLSLKETTRLCEQITCNKRAIGAVKEVRSGDVRVYYTDNAEVSRAFSWKPRHTPAEILESIYGWIKDNESAIKHLL